jgi:hypothetical protein
LFYFCEQGNDFFKNSGIQLFPVATYLSCGCLKFFSLHNIGNLYATGHINRQRLELVRNKLCNSRINVVLPGRGRLKSFPRSCQPGKLLEFGSAMFNNMLLPPGILTEPASGS